MGTPAATTETLRVWETPRVLRVPSATPPGSGGAGDEPRKEREARSTRKAFAPFVLFTFSWFLVWRDATPPPAPTDPLINGGEAWDQDGTVTLTWGQVSDGQSGLEGYYAAFGDEAPTVQADSVISDTETWAGADTPAAPYYVRARDNACAEPVEAWATGAWWPRPPSA